MAEIVLQNQWALLILPPLWLLLLAWGWRRRYKPFGAFLLRLAILVLVVLALSRPVFVPPGAEAEADKSQERQILLVDQSASLGLAGQQALRAEAARLAQEAPQSVVLYFADRAFVVNQSAPPFEGSQTSFNPNSSDLAAALATGQQLLNSQPGRLVLLSDGLANQGDTPAAITTLARQGIPVDVLLPGEETLQSWRGNKNEVSVVKLNVPTTLRQSETFGIEVTINSLAATEAALRLTEGQTTLAEDVVSLEPGLNLFTFEATAKEVGPQTFEAIVAPAAEADGQAANNRLAAFTQVYLRPQILVVSDEAARPGSLLRELREAGFTAEWKSPADLPTRLSELELYDGMVLANVSARSLKLEQMIAIQEFVRSLGRGLLVTGGRDSFSVGAYEDTPLADLLPLTLEPPPREERPPVALLLVIDHSGSMLDNSKPTKLAMAKEAAIRATEILGPQDLIGVLMFDDQYQWVVPFQRVNDGAELLEIQRNIATIEGGGGTRILQALQTGLPALADQEAASTARLAVLLTDGKSFDGTEGREAYDRVVDQALDAKITLSAIAIGEDSDQELLSYLAERGRGRYHFAAVPDELPALTIAESDILRSNALQEGEEYRPSVFAPHPILRGLLDSESTEPADLPDLTGYLAQTPKPRAEVALQVGPGDALLTVWGYGLGRVAAWTSDLGQEWAVPWQSWPQASRFWGQVVGYTLPAPGLGLLQLTPQVGLDGVVTVTADGVSATGQTVDLARTEVVLTTPGGREIPLTLRQIAPGRYQQQVRLPDPGAYKLSATQARPDSPEETATAGFVVGYPVEFNLPGEGTGSALLRQIAETTGGRTFGLGEALRVAGCQPQDTGCEEDEPASTEPASIIANLQSQIQNRKTPLNLWPALLLAALILWPFEIAWRRWGRLRIQ